MHINNKDNSFNKNCLKSLDRKANNEVEKIKLLKELGCDTIDVDLIFEIPNQKISLSKN